MSTEPTGVLGKVIQHAIDKVEFMDAHPALATVRAVCAEVSALCPVTGQPDIYTLTIDYSPAGRIIESKSLKLYLWQFRDRGISCEGLAGYVAQDLTNQLGRQVTVEASQQSRGGIVLVATAAGETAL